MRAPARLLIVVAVTTGLAAAIAGSPPSAAASLPSAPPAPVATAFDRSAEVRWNPPATTAGLTVDAYRVVWQQGNRIVFVAPSPRTVRMTDLPNGSAATFTVAAHTTAGWGAASPASTAVVPTRPNILLILADDQRADSLDQMPLTTARPWRTYSRAFVPEPQCCPARASLLTGRLPLHTGVDTLQRGNRLDDRTTIATMLHGVGYRTILVGKYLNDYPFGRAAFTPPGWEVFRAFTGGYGYYDFTLAGGGGSLTFGHDPSDYATDALGALAIAEARATPARRPLFLYLAPNAPHTPYVEAPRHVGSCGDRTFPMPANFNATDTVSEPSWMAASQPASALAETIKRREIGRAHV